MRRSLEEMKAYALRMGASIKLPDGSVFNIERIKVPDAQVKPDETMLAAAAPSAPPEEKENEELVEARRQTEAIEALTNQLKEFAQRAVTPVPMPVLPQAPEKRAPLAWDLEVAKDKEGRMRRVYASSGASVWEIDVVRNNGALTGLKLTPIKSA